MNKIENLLERYFEGHTSAEEEADLRGFFTAGDIPEHLTVYAPLFVYFENEIKRAVDPSYKRRKRVWWLSGAAACAAAFLAGVFFMAPKPERCPEEGNYVIINGRCYTDPETVRSTALRTLREVSTDGSDVPDKNASKVNKIIESQLKEFEFLFNE
ncbi:MAG: hypothetical protein LBL07_17430 [Tannerella sp.]|jgi:hypothetical protein|nr:hypothetical protein [Tannerella sp.]